MLQRNLADFNERFREEQKEHQHEADWNDNQQVEVLYSDFSDCEDCYEIPPTDSEYDTESEVGVRDRKPDDYVRKGSYEAAEIEAEFAEIMTEDCMGSLAKFDLPAIERREEIAQNSLPSSRNRWLKLSHFLLSRILLYKIVFFLNNVTHLMCLPKKNLL